MSYIGLQPSYLRTPAYATKQFTGNGLSTHYQLEQAVQGANPAYIDVYIDSVHQNPLTAYTIVNSTYGQNDMLAFVSPPGNGSEILIIHKSDATYSTILGDLVTPNELSPGHPWWAAGNSYLGINTASPTSQLHVVANSHDYTDAQVRIGEPGTSYSTGKQLLIGYQTDLDHSYIQSAHWGTSYTDLYLQPSGGSVVYNGDIKWVKNTDTATIGFESTGNGNDGNGRALSNLLFAVTDDTDEGFKFTSSSTELLFVNKNWFQYRSGSNVFTIDSNGNVGIGTSSPSYKLDVYGGQIRNVLAGGGVQILLGNSFNTVGIGSIQSSGDADIGFYTQSSTERMRITSSGNVGIGVVPSSWGSGFAALQLRSGAAIFGDSANLYLNSNSYWNGTNWIYNTSNPAAYYQQAAGVHQWLTAASGTAGNTISFSERMRIDSSGKVGIGTSTPASKLHLVAGATTVSAGNFASSSIFLEAPLSLPGQAFLTFGNSVNNTYTYGAAAINYVTQNIAGGGYGSIGFCTRSVTTDTYPSERMRIDPDGNVGIGTNNPGAILDVNGDALINSLTVGKGNGNVSTNSAVGINALSDNTTGSGNSAVGYGALDNNTTGVYNSAVGLWALRYNTTGSYNTAVGVGALYHNISGNLNSAVGYWSLYNNTGSQNSAFGNGALVTNTTGSYNTAVGNSALSSNDTGQYNSAVGYGALFTNTTGWYNAAVGYNALYTSVGNHNIGIGFNAGGSLTTQDNCVIIGSHAGSGMSSGEILIANGAGTERLRLNASGSVSFSGGGYGTAGQVLKSQGSGSAPTWEDTLTVSGTVNYIPKFTTSTNIGDSIISTNANNAIIINGDAGATGQVLKSNGGQATVWGYPSSRIQPLSATYSSANSGTITVTLDPTTLDFRDYDQATATITTLTNTTALSLSWTSANTLGVPAQTSGTQIARFIVAAINYNGTMVLGIAYYNGGMTFDESYSINTTSLTVGPTSNLGWYSDFGYSNKSYRIVGYVDVNVTHGTGIFNYTNVTKVQGAGGNALSGLTGIGVGQNWQHPTRSINTTYYNITGRPIMVAISWNSGQGGGIYTDLLIPGIADHEITFQTSNNTNYFSRVSSTVIIPNGKAYKVTGNTGSISTWSELR